MIKVKDKVWICSLFSKPTKGIVSGISKGKAKVILVGYPYGDVDSSTSSLLVPLYKLKLR